MICVHGKLTLALAGLLALIRYVPVYYRASEFNNVVKQETLRNTVSSKSLQSDQAESKGAGASTLAESRGDGFGSSHTQQGDGKIA